MSPTKIGIVVVCLIGTLVGFYLGPYHMYDKIYRSGEPVASKIVKLDRPATVTLTPEMNPIRVTGSVRHGAPRNGGKKTTKFNCRMCDESGSIVRQETFNVGAGDNDDTGRASARRGEDDTYKSGVKIDCFDIETAGTYTFAVSRTKKSKRPDFPVGNITLNFRRNVEMVNSTTATLGFAILLLSMFPACWILGNWSKGNYKQAARKSNLHQAETREPALSR